MKLINKAITQNILIRIFILKKSCDYQFLSWIMSSLQPRRNENWSINIILKLVLDQQ